MAKTQIVGYSPRIARRIRKRAGGVVNSEFQENRPRGGGGGTVLKFFELLEDMPPGHGGYAWAQLINWDKVSDGDPVKLYNYGEWLSPTGVIDGAAVGYGGMCGWIYSRWAFVQGECVTPCVGEGAFDFGLTPTEGTIGQTDYAWTPGTTGTIPATGAYSAENLPTDWDINADTGEITGPDGGEGGIAAAGDYAIIIKVATPNTDTGVGGNCISTRRVIVTVNDAP